MTTKDQSTIVKNDKILESTTVIHIGNKSYPVQHPSVNRLAEASKYLNGLSDGETLSDVVSTMEKKDIACILAIILTGSVYNSTSFIDNDDEELRNAIILIYNNVVKDLAKITAVANRFKRLIVYGEN